MAYTTIDDPSAYFQTKLYAGTGSELVITNDGNSDLQPDFIWIKNRTDGSTNHHAVNTSIGSTRNLFVNKTDYEEGQAQSVKSIQSDGFTLGTWDGDNVNAKNFVAWQWKANGGTTTAFSESGNNPGGTYQANTTAGFSIVTYTGTGAAGTVTHGLGVAPKLIIIKNRDVADPWAVYYGDATDYLVLNTTAATVDNAAWWNDTAPSSTVFTVNTDHSVNADAEAYVAYCFTETQGYSKFGTYYGNANVDGEFVYLGFKPAFVMVKVLSDPNYGWVIADNKRGPFNENDPSVYANSDAAETTNDFNGDFLSNGFKLHGTTYPANSGGTNTFAYFAWAENPFVTSTGVPTTAR